MSIGYPDGQRVQNWDGPLLINAQASGTSNVYQSPVINTSRYSSIAGFVNAQSGQVLMNLAWYADQAQTIQIGTKQLALDPHQVNGAQFCIPNMGPWLQVSLSALVNPPFSYVLQAFPTNRRYVLPWVPGVPLLIDLGGQPIAANSSLDFHPTDLYMGPLYVHGQCSAAWVLRLYTLTINGTWDLIVYEPQTAGANFNGTLVVPEGAWKLNVQNTSASATTGGISAWPSGTGST